MDSEFRFPEKTVAQRLGMSRRGLKQLRDRCLKKGEHFDLAGGQICLSRAGLWKLGETVEDPSAIQALAAGDSEKGGGPEPGPPSPRLPLETGHGAAREQPPGQPAAAVSAKKARTMRTVVGLLPAYTDHTRPGVVHQRLDGETLAVRSQGMMVQLRVRDAADWTPGQEVRMQAVGGGVYALAEQAVTVQGVVRHRTRNRHIVAVTVDGKEGRLKVRNGRKFRQGMIVPLRLIEAPDLYELTRREPRWPGKW